MRLHSFLSMYDSTRCECRVQSNKSIQSSGLQCCMYALDVVTITTCNICPIGWSMLWHVMSCYDMFKVYWSNCDQRLMLFDKCIIKRVLMFYDPSSQITMLHIQVIESSHAQIRSWTRRFNPFLVTPWYSLVYMTTLH